MTRSARRSRSSSSSWSGAAATAATTAPTAAATAATAAAAPSAAPEPQAPASSGSVSSGGNGSTFPRKLAEMLGHEPEVVTWSAHGLSFFIGDANALTHELLPKYFRRKCARARMVRAPHRPIQNIIRLWAHTKKTQFIRFP